MEGTAGPSRLPADDDSDCNRVDTTTRDPDDVRCSIPANNRNFRRYIDAAFQGHGPQLPEQIMNFHYVDKCKRVEVEQFVNDFAVKSEECLNRKLEGCAQFRQVNDWCELMHTAGMNDTCNNELALALKTIAVTERFPVPKNANGVDFRLLYTNLSNMVMGLPVQEMNAATQKVLKDVYEEQLAQINQTDNSDNMACIDPPSLLPPKPSTTENLSNENLRAFAADGNLNPLQIPYEKLFYVTK